MRLMDVPSFIRTTDPNDVMLHFVGKEVHNCLPAIIFNTFDDLEREVLDEIMLMSPNIYMIGPLSVLGQHLPKNKVKNLGTNLWKDDFDCCSGWINRVSVPFYT
ncbi:hypothetical protein GIB67_031384 [Kingdonia uniflora]|uniref:Uncharacterized protein n=1 Tax=Kingdonia uniflora TaxID=39325 RepID=A0A7J7MB58_9MAGN|nr:hypothetical protein GIB67_031384 [Kingdonia uniflora]